MPLDDLLNQLPSLDTYSALTAESIFAYANVYLSREELADQLAARDSFYASLVVVPTRVIFNSLLNTRCRDVQSYSQERLIEYILSGAENAMTTEADLALKEKIEKERLSLIQLGTELNLLETAHYQFMLSVYEKQEKQAFQWNDEIQRQAEKLWQAIVECQSDMPPDSKDRLIHHLKTQAAGVVISSKELKALKIQNEPSIVEKSVFPLFLDVGRPVCPNVLEVAKDVDVKMVELQRELMKEQPALLDAVEKVKLAYLEKSEQLMQKRLTINALLLEVNQNVDAFKASEDTINNNENMNTLQELGVAAPQHEQP